jgi:LCP family protein required for cell wall assembly
VNRLNKKLFIKVFLITTLLLAIIVSCALGYTIATRNVGGGEDIEELDRAVPNQRKNILLLGTDKSGLRSDVIMIFSVSQKHENINLMSIPRDTKVKIDGYGTQKINTALALGKEPLTVATVKKLTGISIHDYVTVNFDAVVDVVDALGGIEFDVPQNMYYSDPVQGLNINLKKGPQLLNGENALKLLRFRSYPMADIKRNEVQQEFIKSAFEQKANAKSIKKIPAIYNAVEKNIKSSMSLAEITEYANMVRKMDNPTMQSFELPVLLKGPYVEMDTEKALEIINLHFK